MQLIKLATSTMLLVAATAENIEVAIRRYAVTNCDENRVIWKDVHLDDGSCKTFDHDEPPFESFKIENYQRGKGYTDNHICQIIAHENPNCQGNGYTADDLRTSMQQCVNIPNFAGRSVNFTCIPRPSHTDTWTISPSSVHVATVHVVASPSTISKSLTATTTVHVVAPTSTVVWSPEHWCDSCCDELGEEECSKMVGRELNDDNSGAALDSPLAHGEPEKSCACYNGLVAAGKSPKCC